MVKAWISRRGFCSPVGPFCQGHCRGTCRSAWSRCWLRVAEPQKGLLWALGASEVTQMPTPLTAAHRATSTACPLDYHSHPAMHCGRPSLAHDWKHLAAGLRPSAPPAHRCPTGHGWEERSSPRDWLSALQAAARKPQGHAELLPSTGPSESTLTKAHRCRAGPGHEVMDSRWCDRRRRMQCGAARLAGSLPHPPGRASMTRVRCACNTERQSPV